jgi:phage terminase large subunit
VIQTSERPAARRRIVTSMKLHRLQKLVMADKHRFRVIVAGRRWGKTQFSKISAIMVAARKAKQLIWYVAPTYQMARDIMWEELKASIPKGWIKKNGVNETRMIIRLVNGSRIQLKGADKPDSLRGVGLHFVIIDEAQDIKEETWEMVLQPTLATTNGHAVFIGTPKSYNWFYYRYMLGQRGDMIKDARGKLVKNEWASWQFPTISSPFIPAREIAARRADMDPRSFRQEFEASFEVMSGRVYYPFDRNEHVGDYAFNPQQPIYVGMDFNVVPMSAIMIQEQSNGEIWVVDECVLYGSNVQETSDELIRRYWRQLKQIQIYPDPAGANRNHDRGETSLEILREAGFTSIYYKAKHPLVADRVNSVNRLLRTADGTVRLRINQACRNFIDSAEQTIYKEGSREVDKSQGKEHAMDAFGYYADYRHPMRKPLVYGVSF